MAYPCPPGYCQCFLQHSSLEVDVCSFAYFNGEPDRQCVCEREGQQTKMYCYTNDYTQQVTCVVIVEMVKE